ncbi:MAG: beta-lactamase family protein [Phycisphaerales bacterium]|nr:beta-lactamase family protein [Hyphomonadaceae bacterium]
MRFLLSVAALLLSACASSPDRPALPSAAAIDAEAQRLMASQDVRGMAIAVIDDGQVVHVAAYGHANVAENRALQTDTVMYGASLTKAAFAYMVLQLVDEGRFDLDRPMHQYLPRPLPEYEDYADLAGDERWRQLTARHVLNHTTGFANFRWLEEDQKLRFHFDPGARYGYSGEGFYILQLVLEQGLGLDVGAEMQTRVFDRFAMTRTSMQWRADFRPNLADGYGIDGGFEPHDERSNVSAAGSMDTTIADQARMWAGIVRGEGLSPASRAELVRAQFPILSAHQFPTLRTETDPRGPAINLSAGLGLVTFNDASGPMWFKGGHNDFTGNTLICQEARRRCIVLLANSVRAELIYPEMVRFVLGETAMPWWWEYNPG